MLLRWHLDSRRLSGSIPSGTTAQYLANWLVIWKDPLDARFEAMMHEEC